MMIPTASDPACQGPRPIVVYAHGTRVERSLNQANVTDEDNLEALLAAAIFTSQGYVPVAPNYAGFDSSTLSYHPPERGSATEMPPSRRRITARLFLRSAWTQRSRSSMRIDGDRVSQFILSIARFNSRSATAARASLSLVPGGNSNTSDLSKEFVMRTGAA